MSDLGGVFPVLSTPFHEDGSLDEVSLARLVEHNLGWGVDGLVCFGLAGEVYKLSDEERRRILAVVVEVVAGEVPVVAGTEHGGVEAAVARSCEAVEAGASALMMYPPSFVKPDAAGIADYYAAVGGIVDVPIIVQDAPSWTGVPLPVELLAAISREVSAVRYVKVEIPPTTPKMDALRSVGLAVVGGYGALHVAEELAHGISAVMPGCATPGLYVDLWRSHEVGEEARSWDLFTNALPLLSFQMASLDVFVSVQKLLLHRIGVLSSPYLRRPVQTMSEQQVLWLDRLLSRTGMGRYMEPSLTGSGRDAV